MEIIEFKDYPNTDTPLSAHNLNRMQNNIKENITSSKTASGETLTIENACPVNGKLDISGNSEQETREGYNLLNYDSVTSKTINGITYTINDDKSITANGRATEASTLNLIGAGSVYPLSLEAGDYVLSGCNGGSKDTYIIEIYNGSRYLSCLNGSTLINFSEDTAIRAYITIKSGVTVSNLTFYPMLTKGTEERPYEPHGSMPSPEYPSEIRNVGKNGSVNLKIRRKNLLKGLSTPNTDTNYWDNITATYFTPLEDGWGRFSYDNTNGNGTVFINASPKINSADIKPNTQYTIVTEIRNSTISENPGAFFTSTTNNANASSATNVTIGYQNINKGGIYKNLITTKSSFDNVLLLLQTYLRLAAGTTGTVEVRMSLFEGNIDITDFEYELYEEQTLHFPLAKILHKGDFLADDGIHYKRKTIQINNTNFTIKVPLEADIPIEGLCFIQKKANVDFNYKSISGICTHFKNANDEIITANGLANGTLQDNEFNFRAGSTKDRVYFKNSTLKTITDWENFFDTNEVLLEYELVEEEIEVYTPEQQEAYDKLQHLLMYEGYNYITCIDEIKPNMQLVYYYNNELNKTYANRLDELDKEVNNVNKAINSKVDKIEGKGLSTEDFTTTEKNKLESIEEEANKTIINDTLTSESIVEALSAKQGKTLNEKIINFVGTQDSDNGYCKLANGLKICWGKVNSSNFESFSGNGGFRYKVNLPIEYEQFYFPMVCNQYSQGFSNVNVCSTPSLSELYLGSTIQANNFFVNWLTIGV